MSGLIDIRCGCGFAGTYRTQGLADRSMRLHSCDRQRALAAATARRRARDGRIDHTPKPCTHKRAKHQHGTPACYVADRCRCLPCTAARSTYEVRRKRDLAYGRPGRTVDATPTREHLRALMAAGMGRRQITAVHGIASGSLTKILYGITRADGTRRPPAARVLRRTAVRVLAIPMPTIDQLGGAAIVDSTGARRRVQALVALGWSVQRLADEHGMHRNALDRALRHQPIYARNALAIRAMFDEIGDQRPTEDTTAEKNSASRARNRAQAAGWVVPAMWDEEDLDDPYATPPTTSSPRRSLDLDEWAFLVNAGEDPTTAAQRVGITAARPLDSLDITARRHQRTDILALLTQTRTAA